MQVALFLKLKIFLVEFKVVNTSTADNSTATSCKWALLTLYSFKVNVDASWVDEHNAISIGVVIRDHTGDFFAGISKKGTRVFSAKATEFVAAKEALCFAIDVRFRDIVSEGDNVLVINAIKGREDGVPLGGVAVANIAKVRGR